MMPKAGSKVKAVLFGILLVSLPCGAGEVERFRELEERGRLLEAASEQDQAFACYAEGMAINPAFYDTRFVGDEALEERVEGRRAMPGGEQLFEGAPVGSRVYVFAEEGMGDTIQFCRYIPELVARGYEVIFRPQKPLARLMEQLGVEVDVETPEEELEYDYWMPLLALPHFCFAGVEGIPGKGGYLAVERVESREGIGLVWQGFPGRKNDANRSVPLEKLLCLGELAPLYSLQVGYGREQIVEGVSDLGVEFRDFADTAVALQGLDLLIAVDTSVAHLGGALGVETWILIPYEPDWRWFRDGDTSPFYDTVRLFRQSETDGWDEVIERLWDALQQRV